MDTDETNKEAQMSTDSFQLLVLQRLDELRDDNKMFLQRFDEHVKENVIQFEAIDQCFADAKTDVAIAKGIATIKIRFWGIMASLPAPIAGAAWAIWKTFHGLK